MPAMIPCQRDLFDIPRDVAYLNCAYMSPMLKAAAAAGAGAVARKLQPWTIATADFFTDTERARSLFARIIGLARREFKAYNFILFPFFVFRGVIKFKGGPINVPYKLSHFFPHFVLRTLNSRVFALT